MKYWILLLLVLLGIELPAQGGSSEELKLQLQNVNRQDSLRLMEEWAWTNRKENTEEAIHYLSLAKRICEDSTKFYQLNRQLANILYLQGQLFAAIDTLQSCLHYFNRIGHTVELASTSFDASAIYANAGSVARSDSLLQASKYILIEAGQTDIIIRSYIIEASNHISLKEFQAANAIYQEALKTCQRPEFAYFYPIVLRLMGLLALQIGQYDNALEHFFGALEKDMDDFLRSKLLIHISTIYQELEDWEQALFYQLEALEVNQRLNIPIGVAYNLMEIGTLYSNQRKNNEALNYFERALVILEQEENQYVLAGLVNKSIGDIYKSEGLLAKAIPFFEKALSFFKSSVVGYKQLSNDTNSQANPVNPRIIYWVAATLFELNRLEAAETKALYCLSEPLIGQDSSLQLYTSELLAKIYQQKGDSAAANRFQSIHLNLKKGLITIDEIRTIARLENERAAKVQAERLGRRQLKHKKKLGLIVLLIILLPLGLYARRKYAWSLLRLKKKEDTVVPPKEALQQGDQILKVPSEPIKSMSDFLLTNIQEEKDWTAFTYYFQQVHTDFFQRLKEQYPTITSNELNLCALLKLNVQNKEIAQLLGISHDSVRKAQHRLSKKMNLTDKHSLRDYILLF